jgi:hypothetical protein
MAEKLMIGRHHLNTPLGRQNRNNFQYHEAKKCQQPLY